MRFLRISLLLFVTLWVSHGSNLSNAEETECENGYNISLWVKQNIEIQVDGAQEHPCGLTVDKCLNVIPTNDPNLEPGYALEITSEGKVLRRWPVPVDSLIYAVSGPFIFIAAPNEKATGNAYDPPVFYKVLYNGTINQTIDMKNQSIDSLKCPKIDKPEIGVGFCSKFKDQSTNEIRIIAFALPCS